MTTVASSIPKLHLPTQQERMYNNHLSMSVCFRKWLLRLTGVAQFQLKQLAACARLMHTAIGYFLLPDQAMLTLAESNLRVLARRNVIAGPSQLGSIGSGDEP